jgi:hypothetical protein
MSALFLSSFGLQFSETELCTGLGCVMELAILSYISVSLFKSVNLVYHPLKAKDFLLQALVVETKMLVILNFLIQWNATEWFCFYFYIISKNHEDL